MRRVYSTRILSLTVFQLEGRERKVDAVDQEESDYVAVNVVLSLGCAENLRAVQIEAGVRIDWTPEKHEPDNERQLQHGLDVLQ